MDLSSNALAKESIAYRFESQSTIDDAKEQRDEEWKAAYERLGQKAPDRPEEPVDDGKTLFERLQLAEAKKTAEWDEKMKLGNQWRGLGAEELDFLAKKAHEKRAAEKKIEDQEKQDVAEYRERLAGRQSYLPPSQSSDPTATASSSTPRKFPPKAGKKDVKSLMKGIVVKKKPAAVASVKPVESAKKPMTIGEKDDADLAARAANKREAEEEDVSAGKKQKVDST